MRIYEKLWNEIEEKDWPDIDEIYICLDPQKTLGLGTFSVSRMGNGTLEGDTVELGLFWQKNHAMLFAESYECLIKEGTWGIKMKNFQLENYIKFKGLKEEFDSWTK